MRKHFAKQTTPSPVRLPSSHLFIEHPCSYGTMAVPEHSLHDAESGTAQGLGGPGEHSEEKINI